MVFIPEPAPRCSAGRLFMTPVRLGDPKAAMVRPRRKSRGPKTMYEKSMGRSSRSPKEIPAPIIPPVAKGRAPYRSERIPVTGPAMSRPRVSGIMAIPAHNGVRAKSYPWRGSQIPWSQITSMNISPPRLRAARKLAKTPDVKARILNSWSRNMGSATFVSMTQKATIRTTPIPMAPRTRGFPHPMLEVP